MALPAVERRNFKIGKYDIVAQPAFGSAHMLRYTVLLNGKRLGALLSVPTESDCRFLEAPPAVPPCTVNTSVGGCVTRKSRSTSDRYTSDP